MQGDDSHSARPTGRMPGRQPPRFVPTLTEVVSGPPAHAPHGAQALTQDQLVPDLQPSGGEDVFARSSPDVFEVGAAATVDQLLPGLMKELEPRLVQCIEDRLLRWSREVSLALVKDCLEALEPDLRLALADALGNAVRSGTQKTAEDA